MSIQKIRGVEVVATRVDGTLAPRTFKSKRVAAGFIDCSTSTLNNHLNTGKEFRGYLLTTDNILRNMV